MFTYSELQIFGFLCVFVIEIEYDLGYLPFNISATKYIISLTSNCFFAKTYANLMFL